MFHLIRGNMTLDTSFEAMHCKPMSIRSDLLPDPADQGTQLESPLINLLSFACPIYPVKPSLPLFNWGETFSYFISLGFHPGITGGETFISAQPSLRLCVSQYLLHQGPKSTPLFSLCASASLREILMTYGPSLLFHSPFAATYRFRV
jgi:hypothetical protein